jgi:AcrR family transcriptional regulator
MNDNHSFEIVRRYHLAIIVDKVKKRRDIALNCSDLLLDRGIKNLTIAQIAKTAKVAKGSIYDYFENKEDIVFEIITIFIEEYQEKLLSQFNLKATSREKIFLIFDHLLSDDLQFEKYQNIYKEYLGIYLVNKNSKKMCSFNNECAQFFKNFITAIIEEGIRKDELIDDANNLINGLLAVEKGFLLMTWSEQRDIKEELTKFLNTLFDLIEIKK